MTQEKDDSWLLEKENLRIFHSVLSISHFTVSIFMFFCNNDKGKGLQASEGLRLHLPQSQDLEMKL